MQLYASPTSPFVRKVNMMLFETGLSDRVERIRSVGTPINPGSLPVGVNPLGKVPCLVTDDGDVLYDSRVITRYLDDLSGGGLYPPPPRLWRTLVLEATADGMMEATLLVTLERALRPVEGQSADWIAAQLTKVTRSLDLLEASWMDHLTGPFDMAHIAVACALGYADLRAGDLNWRDTRPALATWMAAFSERDSFQATRPAV